MSEVTVRAAIKTAIESVSNIGLVYDRPRFIDDWADFISIFTTTISSSTVIRGWTIRISNINQTGFITTGSRETSLKREYVYVINGYLVFADSESSEITVTALTIAVLDALDAATLTTSLIAEPAQVTLGTEPFGSALVHIVTITQRVSEAT
jgi:hypothetical protein